MSAVLFFIAAIGVISGAIGVVTLSNPFYSVLALVGHLLSLAVLFLLLRAEFVAAAQVVLYAGAVMVLYVFVVAYVGGEEQSLMATQALRRVRSRGHGGRKLSGALFAGVLLVELFIALLGSGLKAVDGYGAPYAPGPHGFGTPGYIGNLLLTRFLLVFEISSLLLLIAAVGGVVLARRQRGLDGEERDEYSPLPVKRPLGTGTMLEAVEGLPLALARAGGNGGARPDGERGHDGESIRHEEGGW